MSKKYKKGYEPVTSADLQNLGIGLSAKKKSDLLELIDRTIERLVADERVNILVDDNGDFTYELTQKGIDFAKKALKNNV